jgi:UDP:flavonoid glycosyltransferase YjiC (YdhE family)
VAFLSRLVPGCALWGHRVARAGAGPLPVPCRKLTAERLAGAIADMARDPKYREGARRMAETLAQEDGVANAVAEVVRHFGPAREPASRVA